MASISHSRLEVTFSVAVAGIDQALFVSLRNGILLNVMNTRCFPRSFGYAIAFALLLAGCVTAKMYEGLALPKEQISIVSGKDEFFGCYVWVASVDGGPKRFYVTTAHVLPGKHEFEIWIGCYPSSPWHESIKLTFTTKAGHRYQVLEDWPRVWAIDSASGEVVADVKAPE